MNAALFVLLVFAQEKITTNAGCVECHADQNDFWMESVHQKQNVGCIECHGVDSVDPAKGLNKHLKTGAFRSGLDKLKVTVFCAECHEAESKSFMKSVHYEKSMVKRERKLKACANCHASHETEPADAAKIQDSRRMGCVRCHKKATKEYKLGAEYIERAVGLGELVKFLEERIATPRPGIPQAREAISLEVALRTAKDVTIRQHACDYEGLAKQIEAASTETKVAAAAIRLREERFEKRFVWLAGALAVLALNALLVWTRGRKWRKSGA